MGKINGPITSPYYPTKQDVVREIDNEVQSKMAEISRLTIKGWLHPLHAEYFLLKEQEKAETIRQCL